MTDTRAIAVAVDDTTRIRGDLAVPDNAIGTVVFAHGSGSGRHSPRNQMVAAHLRVRHLATLLLDLLTENEEVAEQRGAQLRFEVDVLARRLATTVIALRDDPVLGAKPFGYFGASTGAGAALIATALAPTGVRAVVSRGGRPDLAGAHLFDVHVPTLLLVGGNDPVVIDLNRSAQARLAGPNELVVIPGATHLFEEPGALEEVARLAGDWFVGCMYPARSQR